MTKNKNMTCEECNGNGYVRTDQNKPIAADNTHICSVCQGEGTLGGAIRFEDNEVQNWC